MSCDIVSFVFLFLLFRGSPQVIVRQGDDGNDFFILVEGKVVVTQTNEKGETGIVAELLPAQYFGSFPSPYFLSLLSSINSFLY